MSKHVLVEEKIKESQKRKKKNRKTKQKLGDVSKVVASIQSNETSTVYFFVIKKKIFFPFKLKVTSESVL